MNTSASKNILLNELTLKFLSGDITSEELSELENLIENNPENKCTFDEIKAAWNLSSVYQKIDGPSQSQSSWEKIKKSLSNSSPQINKRQLLIKVLLRNAALWILLISVGAALSYFITEKKSPKKSGLCEISTPLGSRSHIHLPDGSEVWLNAGTTLRYPETFSAAQRDIYLSGEAYFKVASNEKWPFIVHTSDVNIKALGTAFNVTAYPTDKAIITTLVEGIVKIEGLKTKGKNYTYTLKPNTSLTFIKKPENTVNVAPQTTKQNKITTPAKEDNIDVANQSSVIINEHINTVLSTSWKDSRWIIKGEQLNNLAILLERKYDVKINLLSNELDQYKFSGTIENETLEQVLIYLKLTTPIMYTVKKGQVDIYINESLNENFKTYLK